MLLSPDQLGIDPSAAESIVFRIRATGISELVYRAKSARMKGEFFPWGAQRIRLIEEGEWNVYRIEGLGVRGRAPKGTDEALGEIVEQFALEIPTEGQLDIDFVAVPTLEEAYAADPVSVTQVDKNFALHTAIATHAPSAIVFTLTLPLADRVRLSAAAGILDAGKPIGFEAAIAAIGGVSEPILSGQVKDSKDWMPLEADLTKYAGKTIELTLGNSSSHAGAVAFWSNPRITIQSDGSGTGDRPAPVVKNVVLYVIDALRPDQLEAYGGDYQIAPTINRIAREAVLFERCFSAATWTKQSITGLMSGVSEIVHGVTATPMTLSNSLVTLPQVLRRSGITPFSVLENTYPGKLSNLARGFSIVEQPFLREGWPWRYTPEISARLLGVFRNDRFFAYYHTMEPHEPYQPPQYYENALDFVSSEPDKKKYMADIMLADENLDRLLRIMDALDIRDETLLIVTADHGEAFREHEGQTGHHGKPYNELIHVPLIMHMPGMQQAGTRITENVSLIDLAPTILSIMGLPPEPQFQGLDLQELLEGDHQPFQDRMIFAEDKGIIAGVRGDWKILYDTRTEKSSLYNIGVDFGETNDVAQSHAEMRDAMFDHLIAYVASQRAYAATLGQGATAGEIDAQTTELLESLGYLN